jgi:hypothetical protein
MMLTVLRSTSFSLWCGIGLISVSSVVSAAAPTQKSEVNSTEITLNAAQPKWATDEAVRQGMENIHQAMTASQEGIAKERLRAQDYQRLAETIDKNVAIMMDLSQSTELMRSGSKVPLQRAGAFGVIQSLRNYGQHFQHPDWISGT